MRILRRLTLPGFALAWLLVCGASDSLAAEIIDRSIGQFVHTAWSVKDGAPGGVWALAQTQDGYLWLGTTQGLYRFDGVTFERYEPQSGPAFLSLSVMSLLALANGDLWIGFRENGVSLLRNGKNANYSRADGVPPGRVTSLAQDRDGAIWAASDGGLVRFEHDRWQSAADDWGYPGRESSAIYLDRRGTLWAASQSTVAFLPPGAKRFQTTGIDIHRPWQLVESPNGTLWMAETQRSVRPIPLPAVRPPVDVEIEVGSTGILFDDDSSLWVTSLGDGIRRVPFPEQMNGKKIDRLSNAIESFTAKDGLSADYATCLLKDREGDIWVGTSAGVDRFRKGALIPFLMPARFTLKALVPGDGGDMWVGSLSAAWARIRGTTWNEVATNPPFSTGYSFRDPAGVDWLLGFGRTADSHVFQLKDGRVRIVADAPPSFRPDAVGTALAVDRTGTLWLAAGPDGLFFRQDGQWKQSEIPADVRGKMATVSFTDPGGRVWFGFIDDTIMVLDGEHIRTFSAKDGVHVGSVKAIRGRDRHLWIGGEQGLGLWDGTRFRAVVADGDPFRGISGVEEASDGAVWLSEARGVVMIPAGESSRALQDSAARVQYQVFDSRDGLPGSIQQFRPYPATAQGSDGHIWVSTSTGVASINPAAIPRNPLPPPIFIRSIMANGTRYPALNALTLPPRTRNLTVDYTALSLAVPERVRFRYKLEGSDMEWEDAGTRRQAFYTNLGPGKYRFRVSACKNDGVWSEAGAVLNFSISPTYYQTTWFAAACAAALLAMLVASYRLRLRYLKHQFNIRLEARVGERMRIARDFHDTLLQSFQGVLLKFSALQYVIRDRPDEAEQTLERLLEQGRQAIAEGRNAVQGLRSSTLAANDLASAIMAFGEGLSADHAGPDCPELRVQVEGKSRDLPPLVRDEVYRISCEMLLNAFQHSRAKRIEVEISYSPKQFRFRVTDNGQGIDAQVLNAGGRAGHHGLPGMRERAKIAGGKLTVLSKLDSGTQIELTIPAFIAYKRSPV